MEFVTFLERVRRHYTSEGEYGPMVLTLMQADGTMVTAEIAAAGVLDTGHPDGSGKRVTNLTVFAKR